MRRRDADAIRDAVQEALKMSRRARDATLMLRYLLPAYALTPRFSMPDTFMPNVEHT